MTPSEGRERGRQLVAINKLDGLNMSEAMDLSLYWAAQREEVYRRGQCSGGCNQSNLVLLRDHLVCKHTFRECPRRQLAQIVKQLERLNG